MDNNITALLFSTPLTTAKAMVAPSASAIAATVDPSLVTIFGRNGQSLHLLIILGIRWLTALFGATLNFTLLFVTIQSRKLHETCNLFIGAQSFFEMLVMLSQSISFYLALSGINFITVGQCMTITCWAFFANLMRKLALFLVSVDRLMMVSIPRFARKPLTFFFICIIFASIYSSFVLIYSWTSIFRNGITENGLPKIHNPYTIGWSSSRRIECLVTCNLSEVSNDFVRSNSVIIVGFATFNYAILWLVLKWRKTDNNNVGYAGAAIKYTRKIYKTLLAVTILAIFGWMLNPAVRLFLPSLHLNNLNGYYVSIGLDLITNMAMAMDPVVLYKFSSDYRNAFDAAISRWLY